MALVVFLRGVNVGGHRTFRPTTLTKQLKHLDAVNIGAAGTFVIGDPAQTVAIARPGQTARYTFSGTVDQLLRLDWSSATVQGAATVSVSVLKPDGTTLSSGSFVNGATGGMNIAALPSTGTYTVVFDPSRAATMSTSSALATR